MQFGLKGQYSVNEVTYRMSIQFFLPNHQEKIMKLLATAMLTTIITLSLPLPARAELAEIRDPSWQKVPDTFSEHHDDFAYVDTNGVIINEDIVTFDILHPNVNYSRVEANCRTNEFRATRQGYFESPTRLSYVALVDPWKTATEPYHQAFLRLVCNL